MKTLALLFLAGCTFVDPAPPVEHDGAPLDAATLDAPALDTGPDASPMDAGEPVRTCFGTGVCPDGPGANAVCCAGICLRPGECPDGSVW